MDLDKVISQLSVTLASKADPDYAVVQKIFESQVLWDETIPIDTRNSLIEVMGKFGNYYDFERKERNPAIPDNFTTLDEFEMSILQVKSMHGEAPSPDWCLELIRRLDQSRMDLDGLPIEVKGERSIDLQNKFYRIFGESHGLLSSFLIHNSLSKEDHARILLPLSLLITCLNWSRILEEDDEDDGRFLLYAEKDKRFLIYVQKYIDLYFATLRPEFFLDQKEYERIEELEKQGMYSEFPLQTTNKSLDFIIDVVLQFPNKAKYLDDLIRKHPTLYIPSYGAKGDSLDVAPSANNK